MNTKDTNIVVIHETMESIRNRILDNQLLARLKRASKEEVIVLRKQFGDDAIDMGINIIEAYDMLNIIVGRIQTTS